MSIDYYRVVDGQSQGPMSLQDLINSNPSENTLVWKTGLEKWIPAKDMPELADVLFKTPQEERVWFAMLDNGTRQVGPHTVSELINMGVSHDTPVWTGGMADWAHAKTQNAFATRLNSASNNHFSGNNSYQNPYNNPNNNPYNQNNPYNNPYNYNPYNQNNYSQPHTNWMPWAIGATIAAFLFSCIGVVFGIIGIVNANKANNLYYQGRDAEADAINSNARTMTIIGYAFAALGLIVTLCFRNSYSSFF